MQPIVIISLTVCLVMFFLMILHRFFTNVLQKNMERSAEIKDELIEALNDQIANYEKRDKLLEKCNDLLKEMNDALANDLVKAIEIMEKKPQGKVHTDSFKNTVDKCRRLS